ncbi:helix-turn-helix domain-containing protein [Aquimarina macrocephali]|uniref:helix-turn-helix domain-containing protein n=1 Tax=Aquimarina macrocephali TaxID=666563 RepID=UPI000A07A0C3|nr:helix-turn-helix domain-containing protein [Aquimarina macrocephali]
MTLFSLSHFLKLILSVFGNSTYCRYYLIFYILILCSSIVIGQNKAEEREVSYLISEKEKLFITQSDSIRKIENFIKNAFSKEKDTIKGLAYCKVFLQRGKIQEDYNIQYFSSYQIAYIEYIRSNHSNTIKNAYISVKAAEKIKDTIKIFGSHSLLGGSYYVLGAYEESLQSYLKAKELSKGIPNLSYKFISHTNIANVRMKLKRYRDAINEYDLVLKTLEKETKNNFIQYKNTYLSSLLGKGKCLAEIHKLDEALKTNNQGVLFADNYDLPIYKSYFYINLGDIYYKKEEYHKALGFLKQGKDIFANNIGGQQTNLYIANYYIARCLYQQKKYDETISLLNKNFDLIGDNIEADKIENMYKLAIETSKMMGDQEKQISYYDKLQNIIQVKSDKRLVAKDLLYEDDLEDFKIENNKLVSEKTKSVTSKRIIVAVSIVLITVLLSVFLIYRRKTKIKEQKFLKVIEDIKEKKSIDHEPENPVLEVKIKDEKSEKILKELQELEHTHFYISQDCNLYSTAKLLNTNTTYLSKALNEIRKKSFNQYLNELRINYALLKLKEDRMFRSYTIRAVAKETGYKSATTFIKVFKGKTGLNPAYYIKKLELN